MVMVGWGVSAGDFMDGKGEVMMMLLLLFGCVESMVHPIRMFMFLYIVIYNLYTVMNI